MDVNNDLISKAALVAEFEDYLLICSSGGFATASEMLEAVREFPAVDAEVVRWEQIPGFEGLYEINNLAQIRNAKGDVLKQQIRREKYTCYKVVHLWKDGKYHKRCEKNL